MNDYEAINVIVNGYFYSFTYLPPKITVGYDQAPLVFVLGPSLKNINNFIGINLHHLPVQLRESFIKCFQKTMDFMNRTRTILTEAQIEMLIPGISIAKREYNRKYITSCIRIKSKAIPNYIYSTGYVTQQKSVNTLTDWLVKNSYYKAKEQK